MTEPRRFSFGGVPVYNPQSLSKEEALAQFHVRQVAYRTLLDLLRDERPSHVLITGTRGMGKTTLLQRVRYGVEDDAELNSRYLVLAYPEEQYNVNRLHHFLLNTLDALADAMERLQNRRLMAQVEAFAGEVGKRTPEEIEEQVPQFLAEIGRQTQRSFLLLVDNAERLFETMEDRQQWRLRELLSSRRDLTFFGATAQVGDGIRGPKRAFFEFFEICRLTPLTLAEVRDLLLRLSESVEEQESEKGSAKRRVAQWLDAGSARLRTLVQLTGGSPRTTVLLFHMVLDGFTGGAGEYLEQLLDQVTPSYKCRVDQLPAQAQQVLDAVALRWDPITALDVAEQAGLETSVASAQLTRLMRQGVLEKAGPGDSKKALYQVAERFFNIWYLMRANRRVRAKLRWFVEFLGVFFDSGELEQMAWERIEQDPGARRGHPEEISAAVLAASLRGSETAHEQVRIFIDVARENGFWEELLDLCRNYAPFGKILLGICELVQKQDQSNRFATLYRAVALAQLGDFPRASVALEDALTGDPIDLLSAGLRAFETFLEAAVKHGRARDCLDAIDKKDWKDAWRPIYEALRAAESGSAGYLQRVAVEIRDPALVILRRIAPELPDLPPRKGT
jgi:hypothetical protein